MGISLDKIAIHLPDTSLSNRELSTRFNVSESEIFKRTGIETRYHADKNETASDLAFHAATKLFNDNPDLKSKIDYLIFCSDCFDYIAPATSCILQHRLGLPQSTACIDLPYGCSGYVYGLGMANAYLTSGMAKCVLFLTCDTSTKTLNPGNLEQLSIFSDVAAATVITKNDKGENGFIFGTDGSGAHDLYIENSAFRAPVNPDACRNTDTPYGQMVMNGTNVFTFALKTVPKLVNDTLAKNGLEMKDIDLFIFHQANGFMLETLRRKLNLENERFYTNIKDYGNTVVSTLPLALYTAQNEGKLKKGMKVLLAGFGVGNSWGATVINY